MPRIRIDQSNEIVQSRGENTVRIDVVVISFQFSTFVSLMQPGVAIFSVRIVVISFQFSTFVSLMQRTLASPSSRTRCD